MQTAGLEVDKPQFLRGGISYILKQFNSINPLLKKFVVGFFSAILSRPKMAFFEDIT